MHKFTRLLLATASVVAVSTASRAADQVVIIDEPAGYNWSGLYIGVGGGFGANVSELSSDFLPGVSFNGIGGEGLFGEITIGYDYMVSPRFLIGAFADAHYGNIETRLEIPAFGDLDVSIGDTYGFDLGLRAGYLLTPRTLGYVVGGYAWQKAELDASIGGTGDDFDWDRDGYFVGAGLETAISGNWTLKTEYRFTQFSTANILEEFGAPDGILNTKTSRHTFHIAANYRLNAQDGGGAAFDAPAYNWTGFYVSGAFGAGAVVHELNSNIIPGGIEFNGIGGEGVFGELGIGYDHDFGSWVAGVLVDGNLSAITTELDLGGGSLNVDAEYGFNVLGRIGYKLDQTSLAYLIGGYSWQQFDINATGAGSLIDWDSNGFTVGGGLETAVSDKMTVNLEYRYQQFQGEDFDTDGIIDVEPSFHTVRVGAKYKFN